MPLAARCFLIGVPLKDVICLFLCSAFFLKKKKKRKRGEGLTIAILTLESNVMDSSSGHERMMIGWLKAPKCRFGSVYVFWGTRSQGGRNITVPALMRDASAGEMHVKADMLTSNKLFGSLKKRFGLVEKFWDLYWGVRLWELCHYVDCLLFVVRKRHHD